MKETINKEVLAWYSGCINQGLSSKYLANVAIESDLKEHNFPHDNSDFGRCILFKEYCPNAFEKAKKILSKEMPFSNWGCNVAKVWQGYFKHWDYMEKLFKDQQDGLNNGKELYEFMHKIQDESRS